MEDDLLKVRMLTIASSGLLMFLTGVGLYAFRGTVSANVRFFLPLPPIGVAAYIFVFSMFSFYDGRLPGTVRETGRELLYSTLIVTTVFFVYAGGNLLITYLLKKIL